MAIFMQITAGNYDDVINELAIVVEAADFPGEQNEENLAIITEVFLESARLVTMDPTIIDPEVCCHYTAHPAHVLKFSVHLLIYFMISFFTSIITLFQIHIPNR